MKKLRIMTVFGTRPEAIKMCPLVLEMRKYTDFIEPVVAVTAQHREMLDQVLELFAIKPDYDLNIMTSGQTLYDITVKALLGLKDVIAKAQPDLILVHGDTTTTLRDPWRRIMPRSNWGMWKQACVPATSFLPIRKR